MKTSVLRDDALFENARKLKNKGGEIQIYYSVEVHGVPIKLRNNVDAPQVQALKIRAPVVLMCNLSGTLVNGLCGHVVHMHDNSIRVF